MILEWKPTKYSKAIVNRCFHASRSLKSLSKCLFYLIFHILLFFSEIDPSITEAVSGICWAFSHVSDELSEFNQLRKEFKHRYGQEYVKNVMENKFSPFLSKELIRKLTSQPSADLIER